MATVVEHAVDQASELIRLLVEAQTGGHVNPAWQRQWLFRGQAGSAWPLFPSAWRSSEGQLPTLLAGVRERVNSLLQHGGLEAHVEQLIRKHGLTPERANFTATAYAQGRAVVELLLAFGLAANDVGLPNQNLNELKSFLNTRIDLENWLSKDWDKHFYFGYHPIVSLAQHHGVPTRYLDFTWSGLKAAYFAAATATQGPPDSRLAVWAVSVHQLEHAETETGAGSALPRIYVPDRSGNAYLHAQDGVLVGCSQPCAHYLEHGTWPTIDAQLLASIDSRYVGAAIRKWTLPWSQAAELLKQLWLLGVSRAHLMPGYDNVANALAEKWRAAQFTVSSDGPRSF